ncbi:MAG: hypothetical protein N0E48_01185, partial [Candidatus Thiodiazotropha endolucinida]|nr:hypothetical protein [Candidatus Thiodiazotropha taylori]MCW4341983.1 hypothetical protein [Candidatus Thiodiazotropha endolucinida]
ANPLDSLFSALICLANMLTSSVVAVPNNDLDRSPINGNKERLLLDALILASGINRFTVSIVLFNLIEVSDLIVLILDRTCDINKHVALSW